MRLLRAPKDGSLRDGPRSHRILVLCGDAQVGLWVVRSLGRAGLKVFAVCASEKGLSAHSRYCSGAWVIEHPARSPKFIEEVDSLARQLQVASILTISETYHSVLILNRSRWEPDIHVFSPSAECFAKATDKDFMHSLCLELGIPVASGMTLDKLMAGGGGLLRFPLVLRTRNLNDPSLGGKAPWKAAYAHNSEDLSALWKQVQGFASNVLVQEYHPGAEDHVQILMHRGEPFMVGEYIGEHHMPLAGGVTVQRVTCRHEGLIRDAVRLLGAIGWEGIAGLQFHYDVRTDQYIFLEINPRFIGGLPTVIMAGFDAPLLMWQSRFEPDRMRRTPYRLGMRTRILGGDANWALAMIRGDALPPGQARVGKLSAVARFMWNSMPWTLDDTFCLADLEPFWEDLKSMLSHLGQRTHDIIGNPEAPEARH